MIQRPPLAEDKLAMLIGGRWAAAASGEYFESFDPFTGKAWALVPRAGVADVDAAISEGPGLRWALMGPHATFHLAGGEGGIDHFMHHLLPAVTSWWDDLGKEPGVAEPVQRALVAGVAEETGGASTAGAASAAGSGAASTAGTTAASISGISSASGTTDSDETASPTSVSSVAAVGSSDSAASDATTSDVASGAIGASPAAAGVTGASGGFGLRSMR